MSPTTRGIALALCVSAAALAGCGSVDGARYAAKAAAVVTAGTKGKTTSTIALAREFKLQQLDELAAKARIAPLAGPAACSVAVYKLRYDTRGSSGEAVTQCRSASAARHSNSLHRPAPARGLCPRHLFRA